MSSTATIPIPARVADAAVKTPTIMHTDQDGEYVVMRDDGTHGRPARGRILQAAGLAGPCWVRLAQKDYRVATWHSGAAAGLVGFRFEPLTAEEAEQELARQLEAAVELERNRPLIGTKAARPDRRTAAEREAAGDDSPPEPAAARGPFGRPIGAQREPAAGVTSRQARGTRKPAPRDQSQRVAGPASRASTPADRDIAFYR